jgi:hypothetical protein
MKGIARRLQRLEGLYDPPDSLWYPRKFLRLIVRCVVPTSLLPSTCARRLSRDGTLVEIVVLDGEEHGLRGQALEAFIAGFPVERT